MKPFFSYYGSKFRTISLYPRPHTDRIIEPFAGSAAFACCHPHGRVHLNDVDPVVCGVWDYLIRVSSQEVLALPLDFDDVSALPIPQEAKWLIGFWLTKAACKPASKRTGWARTNDVGANNYWSAARRVRIARQVPCIKHWTVSNISYRDLPDERATWFIDPPYQGTPGRAYVHSTIDYGHLAEWCRSRTGQVIACENEGANWLPFENLVLSKSARESVSAEVLWQYPPDTRQPRLFESERSPAQGNE